MDAGTVQVSDRAVEGNDRRVERRRWLARHARTVVRLLGAPPERWADPAFRREVEDIRRSLMPIRTRQALVASFAREGALMARTLEATPAVEGPVPVAYAVRWHELGRSAPISRGRDVAAT